MDDYDLVYDKLYLEDENKFIPESEENNIEYKLRIDLKSKESMENMISQMLYRMNVGKNLFGEYIAHYIMGIMDDGNFPTKELKIKRKTFKKMFVIFQNLCDKANCDIIDFKEYVFPNNHQILYFKIQKVHQIESLKEFNMILYGPTGVGKSSLMSRLCYGQIDDGKGFSRKLVLKHPHEQYSGSTKSNTYDCFGFSDDNIINYSLGVDFTLENIYKASDRIVNVIDITTSKNIKNTIHGILSNIINKKNCMIFVLIDHDIENCLKENYELYMNIKRICDIIEIKPNILITKIDKLDKFDKFDKFDKSDKIYNDLILDFFGEVDILEISNVNDHDFGYESLVKKISNQTKKYIETDFKDNMFIVNSVFNIPDIGNIYHGKLLNGLLKVGSIVNIYCNGSHIKKTIKSIQKKTMSVNEIKKGESGCITFKNHISKTKMSKTSIICENELDMINHFEVKPLNDNINCYQYLCFVGNQIVTVNLIKENDKFYVNVHDNKKIKLYSNFIILKDQKQNLEFCLI